MVLFLYSPAWSWSELSFAADIFESGQGPEYELDAGGFAGQQSEQRCPPGSRPADDKAYVTWSGVPSSHAAEAAAAAGSAVS